MPPTISKNIITLPKEDEMRIWADLPDAPVPQKPVDLGKYPSPRPRNKLFTQIWNEYIGDITERDNFKYGHLRQLGLLCDLYVSLADMDRLIKKHGYTYSSESRGAITIKPRPEVTQRNIILGHIRSYSKILGLLLTKDSKFVDETERKDEWS